MIPRLVEILCAALDGGGGAGVGGVSRLVSGTTGNPSGTILVRRPGEFQCAALSFYNRAHSSVLAFVRRLTARER